MKKVGVGLRVMQQIREAIQNLNPNEVRATAERPFTVGLHATDADALARMEAFFAKPNATAEERLQLSRYLHRAGAPGAPEKFTIEVYQAGMDRPEDAFSFDPALPQAFVTDVLARRDDLSLPLARRFTAFRQPVVQQVIRTVSKENAMFSLATAVPGIVPLLSVPLAVGEFASDAAVLTMNQIRMAFLIAAAHGCDIGYGEQRGEVGSIIAGAFGWRAIARELVGKIPLGGGLIPKAGIAYAGTYVVGLGLERYYQLGQSLPDAERRAAYEVALERGKAVASAILEGYRRMQRKGPVRG